MLSYESKPNQNKILETESNEDSLPVKTRVDLLIKTESNQDSLPVKTRVDISHQPRYSHTTTII